MAAPLWVGLRIPQVQRRKMGVLPDFDLAVAYKFQRR
jgi:hypothetical protein